jgi:hypothetical protein
VRVAGGVHLITDGAGWLSSAPLSRCFHPRLRHGAHLSRNHQRENLHRRSLGTHGRFAITVLGGDPSNPTQVTSHSPLPGFTETIQGTWHPPQPCIPNTGPGTAVCQNGGFSPTSITVISGPLAWSPTIVPDPSTALPFGSGLVGLALAGRRWARLG